MSKALSSTAGNTLPPSLPPPGGLPPGEVVAQRYRIERELGRGGMGVVYLGRDIGLVDRKVVVKVLDEKTLDEWGRSRFDLEIEALARQTHPGIVAVLDRGRLPDDRPFFVMQFVEGRPLRSHLLGEPLPFEVLAPLITQVGQALSHAHERGVVHRDLKPENIMLQDLGDQQLRAVIIDFGVARVDNPLSGDHKTTRFCVGTFKYMAPEQLQARKVTAATDIYALGIMAYEFCTGHLPFNASTPFELFELQRDLCIRMPREINPSLPEQAEELILSALSFEPSSRPASARQFGEALAKALTGASSLPLNWLAPPPDRAPHPVEGTTIPTPWESVSQARRLMVIFKHAPADEALAKAIQVGLSAYRYDVYLDLQSSGIDWAQEVNRQISGSGGVIVLVSEASVKSEMVAFQVQLAHETAQRTAFPRIVPVWVDYSGTVPEPLGGILERMTSLHWKGPEDTERLIHEIASSLRAAPPSPSQKMRVNLEPVGGAVPLDSKFYVLRSTDGTFANALARRDSIVLVKGARQMGKTSLLARSLQRARENGDRVVFTDFQKLNAAHMESPDALYLGLADAIADQLKLEVSLEDVRSPRRGPNMNFERYICREVLSKVKTHLVWGLDEVDRLFTTPFASEVFGLFRSWHNERSLDPGGPWQRLTLAIAYATEAHLFISDVNQSPFNVGTRLSLEDFTYDQVMELNRRHGSPLNESGELTRFYRLVGGHPYLVRSGLYELVSKEMDIGEMEAIADRDEGPFGDHLRRILLLLARDADLQNAVREVLRRSRCPNAETFYRLRAAGLIVGDSATSVRARCLIYTSYLGRHLG